MCCTEAKRNIKEESNCYILHTVVGFCIKIVKANAEKI